MAGFLPKLDQAIIGGAANPGQITHINDIVNDFINKIKIQIDDYDEISSFIPNLWSRIVLFGMVTDDREHPLASRLIGELKGLLAMIALKGEFYNWNITMQEYEFRGNETLDSIARTLYPGNIRSLYLIRVGNQIIGGCLDSDYYTGFFTSAEYNLEDVPWFDNENNVLTDPISNNRTGIINLGLIRDALGCWKQMNNIAADYLWNWQHNPQTICSLGNGFLLPEEHPLRNWARAVALPLGASIGEFLLQEFYYSDHPEHCKIIPIKADAFKRLYEYSKATNQDLNLLVETDAKRTNINVGQISLSKSYNYKESKKIELPTVCLWPDFKVDDWNEYYIWQSKTGDVNIEPLVDAATNPKPVGTEHSVAWKLESPPIGLKVINKKGEELGIIRVEYSREQGQILGHVDESKRYKIGFDFGTTHTTIVIKDNDGEPKILAIKDRVRYLTTPDFKIKDRKAEFTVQRDKATEVRIPLFDFIERDFMPSSDGILAAMPTLYKKKLQILHLSLMVWQ